MQIKKWTHLIETGRQTSFLVWGIYDGIVQPSKYLVRVPFEGPQTIAHVVYNYRWTSEGNRGQKAAFWKWRRSSAFVVNDRAHCWRSESGDQRIIVVSDQVIRQTSVWSAINCVVNGRDGIDGPIPCQDTIRRWTVDGAKKDDEKGIICSLQQKRKTRMKKVLQLDSEIKYRENAIK